MTLIFSRENMCSHTVLAKLLLSLFLLFFVLPPTHPISLSLLYISHQFHFAKLRTWNLIFDLKNTYTCTVFDVLSEDLEGNAF